MVKKGKHDDYDVRIIVKALITEGRYTNAVNNILLKLNKSSNASNS